MKRWTIPVTLTALLAGLALAATLAHAQPEGPPMPADDAVDGQGPPAHAGPPDDVGPPAHAGQPDEAGPGQAISEAARRKVKDVVGEEAVTNPAGHVAHLSLVGFCRSQAPWMSDKGDACDELNAIFQELREVGDNNAGDADDDEGAGHRGPPSQPGHRAARVGVEMARGLLQHVMSLVGQA